MSRTTFCNDADLNNASSPAGFTQVQGVNTADIIDQIANIDYHVCNKMGTSIPTIFARMFLFSGAYKDINKLEETNHGIAHNYASDKDTGKDYKNVYHYLVSEHLDMLEFLFTYGNEITVEEWEFNKQIGYLQQGTKTYPGLGRLLEAVDAEIKGTPFLQGNLGSIFLFKYKNEIVGGTSPNLIVFTNPNWKEIIAQNNWSNKFNQLFSDTPRALHERQLPFRQMLTMLEESGKLSAVADLETYIRDNKDNYDSEVKDWWNKIYNNNSSSGTIGTWIYPIIKEIAYEMTYMNNGTQVNVVSPNQNIPIYRQSPYQKFSTDYKIKPTTQGWQNETINGAQVTLRGEPMLVVENGIPQANYFNSQKWNNAFHIQDYSVLKNTYLSERTLPGINGTKYPFITADDLFEESIVELAYNIDKGHFFTGCDGDFNFMLPIKHLYFRFFTFADLKKSFSAKICRDSDGEITSVDISLNIPMEKSHIGQYKISRSYVYSKEARYKIINCRTNDKAFDLGIFPFFYSKTKPNLNDYRFIKGESSNTKVVECRIGLLNKLGYIIPKNGKEGVDLVFEQRSHRDALTTSFAEHNGTFEYIDVTIEVEEGKEVTGMFFPLMKEIDGGLDDKWFYSVDFGTSNTHIVMANSQRGVKQDCQSFCYRDESQQMVTFGLEEKNKFIAFKTDIKREFVPKELGFKGSTFPINSVIYEKDKATTNTSLFKERNIGFYYKNETAKNFVSNSYISDIKWNISDQMMFTSRVNAYCLEILWMLRNHSLSNGGTEKIKVAITYPLAMSPTQIQIIKVAWRDAWKKLVDKKNAFEDSGNKFILESVAPYKFSAVNNNELNRTDAYVNVDIGGGSTDILYYKENPNGNNKSFAYSVVFAANDIWGNGLVHQNRKNKENGYIKILKKRLNQDQLKILADYEGLASNSIDVVNYLFSKQCRKQMQWDEDDDYFSKIIKQSEIGSILIVHFAALMYYLAYIIKIGKLETPKMINFTGMGSKYIDIITPSSKEVEDLIKKIFTCAGLHNADNVKVNMENNPKEVTAIGALYMLDEGTTKVSSPISKNIYCIDGEEEMDEAPSYEYSRTDECREKAVRQAEDFLKLLKDGQFLSAVKNTGINYSFENLEDNGLCSDSFNSSYIEMTDSYENLSTQGLKEKLKDSPFFWTLRDTLYKIAIKIGSK